MTRDLFYQIALDMGTIKVMYHLLVLEILCVGGERAVSILPLYIAMYFSER